MVDCEIDIMRSIQSLQGPPIDVCYQYQITETTPEQRGPGLSHSLSRPSVSNTNYPHDVVIGKK